MGGDGGTQNIVDAIARAAALEPPLISAATPKESTVRKILEEIRQEQNLT